MKSKSGQQIQFFLGEDTKASRTALLRAVEALKAKDENALTSNFNDSLFDPLLLNEALLSVSLFGSGNLVVIDGILDHEDGKSFYENSIALRETPNTVLVREQNVPKDLLGLFQEIGKIEQFPLKKIIEKRNNFALADAVAARDKRAAWVEFSKQKRQGAAMEEIHGMVFWAVKSLYIAKTQTKEGAIQAGVKEYTFSTYRTKASSYLVNELEEKLSELKDMYHNAHQGDGELDILLEKFLLKI